MSDATSGLTQQDLTLQDLALQESVNELLTLYGMGRLADMERRARMGLESSPQSPILCELLGMAIAAQRRPSEALAFFERAARGDPNDPQFWENLGQCQRQLKQYGDAEQSLRRALALRPQWTDTLDALAAVLRSLGRHDDAHQVIDELASIDPNYTQTQLQQQEQYLRSAVAANSAGSDLHDELGQLLRTKGDLAGAEASMRRAIECDRRNARAHINVALLLSSLRRDQEALAAVRTALSLLGAFDATWPEETRELYAFAAFVLHMAGECGDAVAMYKVVRQFNRDPSLALAMTHAAREACDWAFAAALEPDACKAASAGLDSRKASPWQLLCLACATSSVQLAAGRSYARQIAEGVPRRPPVAGAVRTDATKAGRLRVSYFSRDFYDHATAVLLVGVIEAHDRGRYEIVAHDFSPASDGIYRRRLASAFDRIIPVGALSDESAARRIAADNVDVIVDLNGWTTGHRGTVLAFRPATLQLQWLGYPGTLGAPWIDYVIADGVVIPPGDERHFSEKVVRLPDCYQPNDDRRPVSQVLTRREHGLPEDAVVFCSFNQAFKLTADVFSVWMELLTAVDKAVLWLLAPAATAAEALLREATARGIDPQRIVFAPRLPFADHRARLAHADLALDCSPYGSHTTASDMLWAGVPLIALQSDTFASRVSASVLTAAGLPDLVVTSPDDYRHLALRLANDREELAQVRSRVQAARSTSALFDTQRFTRNLERAFEAMWDRHARGLPPDHITI